MTKGDFFIDIEYYTAQWWKSQEEEFISFLSSLLN